MGAIKDGLLAEYDHEVATTRRMLARLPDHKLSWQPHGKSMTLGGLATHLCNIPSWGDTILGQTSFDLADAPPNLQAKGSCAEILAFFDETTTRTRSMMDKTDAEYVIRWRLRRGGHEIFSMPRVVAFRTFVLYHIVHHRGQLSVYLRMNDIPVPPIYGPTADEG